MTRTFTFLFTFTLILSVLSSQGQVKNVQEEAERQGTRRINRKIDKGIDKGFDKIEEGIGGIFGKKKKNKNSSTPDNGSSEKQTQEKIKNSSNTTNSATSNAPQLNVQWSKFDFVPGDEVIFEDGPDIMEENGEFPSRWDLHQGQVEIMMVNGENVIGFIEGSPEIVPYLKNPEQDYLPEIFTVEFDIYRPAQGNRFTLYLFDRKNQEYFEGAEIEINLERADIAGIVSEYESGKSNDQGNWMHISLAFTKGKLKIYIDENRLINIPHYEGNPSGLSFQAYWADSAEGKTWYMKNVRIAKGGVKYYDRVLSEGKIVCNGIRFDVNKATLKPESMGPINKIYELMQKQPTLKFRVEGHTDADGDEAKNQILSEQRAKAVADKLISMGISADRLTSKGFGESVPVNNNSTPEGRANNRRVEFVKM